MTRRTNERVRKTSVAAAVETSAVPETNVVSDESSLALAAGPILILHLRLRTKDLEEDFYAGMQDPRRSSIRGGEPDTPEAYDRNPFAMAEELKMPGSKDGDVSRSSFRDSVDALAAERHLPVYTDGKAVCWWCCHGYEGDTVSIPLECTSSPSYGYGNFCSFPCACAYLFGQEEMSFRRWERFSLLCSEYRKMGGRYQRVPQAPPRQTLRMFGGTLHIDEFRKLTQRECAYRVVTPTLVHVQPTISVVPLHQMAMTTVTDVATARTQNRSSMDEFSNAGGLRLKRTKPILDGKNTLEHYIQGKMAGKIAS